MNSGYFYMKTFLHLRKYLAKCFLQWEISYTKIVEKIKTHILCLTTFAPKITTFSANVEKYRTDGQDTWQYNKVHALCMLDNQTPPPQPHTHTQKNM